MRTYNIAIPSSLRVLTSAELERALITSIAKPVNKKDLLPSLEERFDTRRAANSVANQLSPEELASLHNVLQEASKQIDFDGVYFLHMDSHRRHVTIRQ